MRCMGLLLLQTHRQQSHTSAVHAYNSRMSSDYRLAVLLVVLAIAAGGFAVRAADAPKQSIAHRGASGYAPEHTRAAYQLALDQRADFVEQDLAVTRDGVLICLHDDTLERTSNVAEVFPDRSATTPSRGGSAKRWFANDFTLDEIRRLDMGALVQPEVRGRAHRHVAGSRRPGSRQGRLVSGAEVSAVVHEPRRRHGQAVCRVGEEERAGSAGVAENDSGHRAVVRRADRAADGPGTAEPSRASC